MTTMTLLTLLVGVVALRAAAAGQSELLVPDEPMAALEDHVGERRVERPEVVLQLKYDRGELNKIYLAQFRKGPESWAPSVPARTNLCADLCHAGLGGESCGSSCADMLPVGLQAALRSPDLVAATHGHGEPREAVCPTLCDNHLGEPLCNCSGLTAAVPASGGGGEGGHDHADWSAICDAFCRTDNYVLGGCPPCEESSTRSSAPSAVAVVGSRALATADGWAAWCGVQCGNGHGGAACNCDRSPLQ